jgi:hypothetical protein
MPLDILIATLSFLTLVMAWVVLPGEGKVETVTAPAGAEPVAA